MNAVELKKYLADIFARMSQVVFTLLVITPFIAIVFSWQLVAVGIILFVVVTVIGAIVAASIKEE